jgi:hypothetical protein
VYRGFINYILSQSYEINISPTKEVPPLLLKKPPNFNATIAEMYP